MTATKYNSLLTNLGIYHITWSDLTGTSITVRRKLCTLMGVFWPPNPQKRAICGHHLKHAVRKHFIFNADSTAVCISFEVCALVIGLAYRKCGAYGLM